MRAREVDGAFRFVNAVRASRKRNRFVQGLHAERTTGSPGGAESCEFFGLGGIRIGFERDFGIRLDGPQPCDRFQRVRDGGDSISDGVPPPKKMELTRRPGSSAA